MSAAAPTEGDFPKTIADYELVAPIGTGGMGRVYLARREVLGGVVRNFAIKLLHQNLRDEATVAAQLLDEAKLAARINHPNVVEVVGGGTDGEHVYVAMEYVAGVTLADMVRYALHKGEPIPPGIVARVVCDALSGLHAAHEARDETGRLLGLVHRDFSPQNILVSGEGVSKLADFGIAKAIDRIGGTATGVVKGKVSYLSPEQALGKPVDRRSDVWSAGVVLWESLVGQRLFGAENDTATLLEIVSGHVPPTPSSRRPDLGPAIDEVVSAALVRDRNARVADAHELRDRVIAAWRVEHDVADPREVARYVAPLIEPKLVARRLVIEQLERQDDAPTSVIRPITSLSPESAPGAPNNGRMVMAIAAGLVALAVAFGVLVSQPSSATAKRGLNVMLPTIAPAAAELTIVASEPVAQIEIDGVSRIVPAPAKQLLLPGVGGGARLVLLTSDGRRAQVDVAAGQSRAEVTFPRKVPIRMRSDTPIPKPTSKPVDKGGASKTTPPKATATKREKGPGLGPSPYNDGQ